MRFFLIIFLPIFLSVFAADTFAQKKSAAAADIREIILETGDGFCFDCERVIKLRSNNAAATFHGGKNSHNRRGDFSGKLAAKDFTKLAQAFIKNGFFNLTPRYEGTTSDVAMVKITVVNADGSKSVENFGGSEDLRLKKIEQIFNAAANKIVWRSVNKKEKNED